MKALFAVLVSITILSSEIATENEVKMISDLASYGLEVAQDCAKENRVSLVKIMSSLLLSRSAADRNSKCAIACILENFFLLIDNKVETAMVAQFLDVIPTDSLKTQAAGLINKCEKKESSAWLSWSGVPVTLMMINSVSYL
ncbi:uncharacterized protein LOC111874422 isoform X2 [Cryptotermes secundus]|uniref:uncharacterized protein LOC111874422 isoform X2 n=1 Tax=Cryptotermes secundus TaxID=105785 RepID=UPI000CD7B456|nr:uncharacterized protein LOC111874422 isoform X2 [Cryptotermes secundus]